MDNQAYNDDLKVSQYRRGELTTLSPIRSRLRGTVLGMFLETRERRYLLSFIFYSMAFILFAGVIIYVIQAITSGSILSGTNHGFYGKIFNIVCWISAFVTIGAFTAQRYAMSIQSALVTVFLIFLAFVRP